MISGIYTITAPSGNFYVGSAADMRRRWAKHLRDLERGVHGNCNLQRAAAKYGIPSLVFRIILVCDRSCLLLFEQRAIDILSPPYNIARVAGSCVGIKRTDEFKAKVSAGGKGRIISAETREKIAAPQRGKKRPPHVIKAMRDGLAARPMSVEILRANAARTRTPEIQAKRTAALIGRPVLDATRKKISAALKGRPHSPERIAAITAGKIAARSAAVVLQNG